MTKAPILLVEDNDDDAELLTRALGEAKISNPLVRTVDGVDALDYLFARNAYANRDVAELPSVIFLDLKLPRLDGLDVLKAIRETAATKTLPVVMLTSSDHQRDRAEAYQRGVNSYVRKPEDYDQFVSAASQLGLYWAGLNLRAG